jgi:ABC-type branched-subunit amino acid transport system ATPase component
MAHKLAELRVDAVCKRFGGLVVFDRISFSLPPGETLGVIGPNGAGKTTLINVICGKLSPTSGTITLGGRSMGGQPLHALARIGVVRSFQQTNTFKGATVRENIARAIRFSGNPPGTARLDALLREFGLHARLDEPSDKLPYGLQKVLGLVLAFATGPRVLLLDEPAAGLERRERTMIDSFVRTVQAEAGCSVLIVEHDMELVRRLCPRIIVLDAGHVLAEGTPDEVLNRPDVIDAYMGVTEAEEIAA